VEVTLDKGSFKGGTTFLRMQQQQKKHSSHSFFVNERGFNVVLFLVLMLPRLWLSYLSLFVSFPCLPGATIFCGLRLYRGMPILADRFSLSLVYNHKKE
jgi:hypothetical protein